MLDGNRTKTVILDGEKFSIIFSHRIDDLSDRWPSDVSCPNIFMSRDYLKTVESASADLKGFIYVIVLDESEAPMSYFYYQLKQFNAAESLNYTLENTFWDKIQNKVKRWTASLIDSRGLVCGNLLVTGNHGCYSRSETIERVDWWKLNQKVHHQALHIANEMGHKIGFVLGKDYEHVAGISPIAWNAVKVQPNMVMYLRPEWHSIDDYLASMKSKYRKRTRSALRKASSFGFKNAEVEDIERNIETIYALYLEIVDRAPFNMFVLSKEYFINLKSNLGELCQFTLVYKENELVAFQINLINHEHIDAHFLGYNHDYLVSHDLYLNLLLNSVKIAIENNSKSIVFSRTAMQIKSSIGAIPEDLYLYLALQNKILNKIVNLAFRFFNPPVVFNQRHPFKES